MIERNRLTDSEFTWDRFCLTDGGGPVAGVLASLLGEAASPATGSPKRTAALVTTFPSPWRRQHRRQPQNSSSRT